MTTQVKLNMETLLPSSLLEEDLSDNENISNFKIKPNVTSLKENSHEQEKEKEKEKEKVFHIFNYLIHYIGRTKWYMY